MSLETLLPPLNEGLMITSALAVGAGWYFIRRKKVDIHRRLMITAAFLGAGFFVSYVVKTLAVGDTAFGGPGGWRLPYHIFLQSHATLATVAGILGVITLRFGLRSAFKRHRRVAPWTATLWLISAASGLVVYLLLYVIYPPGPTENIIRLMIGL